MPYMKKSYLLPLLLTGLLFALPASASVVINEIAWMGTADSSANEWIELRNSGGDVVDLSGWRIDADDGSPAILLSGTISAGGFFLIERTDDDTVPGISADIILTFGNGLSNGGEILKLKDGSENVIDTVVGVPSWENIGGDSTTKETAQRIASGWISAPGTPRAPNVAADGEVAGAGTTTSPASTGSSTSGPGSGASGAQVGGSGTLKSPYPRSDISVFSGDDTRAFVGFAVQFLGNAKGLYDESLIHATYRWNFGDGATGEGVSIAHQYQFEGEYIVTLEVFWSSYQKTDRLSVTVSVPEVLLNKIVSGDAGYIELVNRTSREIDLYGWILRETTSTAFFAFPRNSVLLPGKSLTIPNTVSSLRSGGLGLSLSYPNGTIAHVFAPAKKESILVGAVAGAQVVEGTPKTPMIAKGKLEKTAPTPSPSFVANSPSVTSDDLANATNTAAIVLWDGAKANVSGKVLGYDLAGGAKWFFVFAGVLLIALAVYILARSRVDEATLADEYAIIEDIIEGDEATIKESERIIRG